MFTHKSGPEPVLYMCVKGLDAALMQRGQPIAYISCALTPTEQRYAQIEKECLAIVYALQRFHQYTIGRNVLVHSYRKPLESIPRKPLASAPRRLQGMMMQLQKYDVTVSYERGNNILLADLLFKSTFAQESRARRQRVCQHG